MSQVLGHTISMPSESEPECRACQMTVPLNFSGFCPACAANYLKCRELAAYFIEDDLTPAAVDHLAQRIQDCIESFFVAARSPDCSGSPESCPSNEGRGCDCDALSDETNLTTGDRS